MVDLSTAMSAAAASDRKGRGRDGEKKRPGGKVGTEPFDPVEHVQKEKADTASMWLVIAYGSLIALLMRFGVMPALEGPASVLWSLPLLLVFTVPTLHRVLLRPFAERYSFSNWFRGGFLYVFTWLAITFIVVNPPLADISPPETVGKGVLFDFDDADAWNTTSEYIALEAGETTAENTAFAFAVRDNVDVDSVTVHARLLQDGHEVQNWTGSPDDLGADWDPTLHHASKVQTKRTDAPVVLVFDAPLAFGSSYDLVVTLQQEGDPWSLEEKRTWTFEVGPERA